MIDLTGISASVTGSPAEDEREPDEGSERPDPTETDEGDSDQVEFEDLTDVDGIGPTKARRLREAGIESVEDLREADADELTTVRGISEALASEFKSQVTPE